MGTNYYHKHWKCECCGRSESRHIGKKSIGWAFLFRGYDNIKSFQDWVKELEASPDITDEYGDDVHLDTFLALVQTYKYERNHALIYPDYGRLDSEGYPFIDGEFE